MKRLIFLLLFVFFGFSVASCSKSDEQPPTLGNIISDTGQTIQGLSTEGKQPSAQRQKVKKLPSSKFQTVEWTDLLPQEDKDALSVEPVAPPHFIPEDGPVEDPVITEGGSMDDPMSIQVESAITNAVDERYQQALVSKKFVPELDGKPVRLSGFIVPLEFDDEQKITQFFLVPFFGACIHVPPPPPNQIIFVNYPEGLQLNALYDPFWISGILKTSLTENEIATSAYSMDMQYFEPYNE